MRHAYEILRDPTDRYLLWDLVDDAPVTSVDRIVTFPALAETREFLDVLRDDPPDGNRRVRQAVSAARSVLPLPLRR